MFILSFTVPQQAVNIVWVMHGALCCMALDLWPYEMYKAGCAPFWNHLQSLNILAQFICHCRRTPTPCIWSRSWRASKWCWISKTNSSTSRKSSWWRLTNWWDLRQMKMIAGHQDKCCCWQNTNTWITQLLFFSRKRKMWSWMRALRRSSRRMRTWKPAWIDMLHCRGKTSWTRVVMETRLWSI